MQNTFSEQEVFYMQEALKEARQAFLEEEVPIGAVIVREGKIIARGRNSVEKNHFAIEHAEINCLKEASKVLQNWRLIGTTMYVTVEPCPMCAGAIHLARVERVVWGCPNIRYSSGIGEGGLLAEEAKQLLQEFFKKQRANGVGEIV